MGLFKWLKSLRPKRDPSPEVIMARQVSERIIRKADAIQDDLNQYLKAQDPLAALFADVYNRNQVAKIWRNGHG